jgi:flagellar basal-body rod protein FlgB
MLQDVTSVALHSALSGLSLRQRVTANNIANISTPGFRAGRVSFEDSLRQAVENGSPADAASSISGSGEAPRLEDDNNVNLDRETLINVDTGLRYSLALRAMDDKFQQLGTVIKGSAG